MWDSLTVSKSKLRAGGGSCGSKCEVSKSEGRVGGDTWDVVHNSIEEDVLGWRGAGEQGNICVEQAVDVEVLTAGTEQDGVSGEQTSGDGMLCTSGGLGMLGVVACVVRENLCLTLAKMMVVLLREREKNRSTLSIGGETTINGGRGEQ
uniref:Uncharacterized protein n=1 Tax=Fagus sylvatica TaxID=28930 RepID=A0A2N9FER9_FAGSY